MLSSFITSMATSYMIRNAKIYLADYFQKYDYYSVASSLRTVLPYSRHDRPRAARSERLEICICVVVWYTHTHAHTHIGVHAHTTCIWDTPTEGINADTQTPTYTRVHACWHGDSDRSARVKKREEIMPEQGKEGWPCSCLFFCCFGVVMKMKRIDCCFN